MKNKKEFFGVLFSVLICVLVVFAGVYAATTIGTNITAEGTIAINGSAHSTELSVIGTASISEDLWASGSFQFGGGEGVATASYSRLGSSATGHSLSNANDLLVAGSLEVDGTAYFDGVVSLSHGGTITVGSILGHTDSGQYLIIGDAGTTGHSLAANDDLLVSGKLEVDGTAYFDGTVSLSHSGTLYTTDIIGVRDTGLYLRIGDEALTSHSLAADDDLLVNGKLEVDGTAYFDDTVSVSSSGLLLDGGVNIITGTASPQGSTTNCTVGDIYIRSGATLDTTLNICDETNVWTPADL